MLHVVDVASPDLERRLSTVHLVLDQIGLGDTPELLVCNQADRLPPGEARAIAARLGGVAVSALDRSGLAELLGRAEELLWNREDAEPHRREARDLAAARG